MSFYMTGETIKKADLILIFITFIGVTIITYGFSQQEETLAEDERPPILAVIGAFFIPILLSYGNVLMRTMQGLDENTVALYMNPSLAAIMYLYLKINDLPFWSAFEALPLLDWVLIIFFSVNTVIVQTLKFKAL